MESERERTNNVQDVVDKQQNQSAMLEQAHQNGYNAGWNDGYAEGLSEGKP